MKSIAKTGFSLIELMVVLAIIGIFSALAIPGIMEIRYRNTLTDSVERIRSAASATRDLAMQTRQAAVLEVSATGVWVNLLSDARCTNTIQQRCTTSLDRAADGSIPLYDSNDLGATAGVAFCGGFSLALQSGSCNKPVALARDAGFALCYSGAGELYYRADADENTGCDKTADPSTDAAWSRACSAASASAVDIKFSDNSDYKLSDGAVLIFNRYEENHLCENHTTNALDNRRLIVFPTNGSPFSTIQ